MKLIFGFLALACVINANTVWDVINNSPDHTTLAQALVYGSGFYQKTNPLQRHWLKYRP
jgi:hypothetical protein